MENITIIGKVSCTYPECDKVCKCELDTNLKPINLPKGWKPMLCPEHSEMSHQGNIWYEFVDCHMIFYVNGKRICSYSFETNQFAFDVEVHRALLRSLLDLTPGR